MCWGIRCCNRSSAKAVAFISLIAFVAFVCYGIVDFLPLEEETNEKHSI